MINHIPKQDSLWLRPNTHPNNATTKCCCALVIAWRCPYAARRFIMVL